MANDVASLLAIIRARVNVADTTILPDAQILEAINDTQERMVQAGSEWLTMDQSLTFTYGVNADGVPLPSNFAKIAQVSQVDPGATPGDPSRSLITIEPTERRQWIAAVSSQTFAPTPIAGGIDPTAALSAFRYYLWLGKIFIVPQPTQDVSIVLDYFGPPVELTLSEPNNRSEFTLRFFRALKWGALSDVWDYLGQEDMALAALARFEARLDRARAVETAARVAGPKRVRGA